MNKQLRSTDWDVKPLSEICKVVSGGTPSRDIPEYWHPSEVIWVTPTDITGDNQRILTNSKEKISEKGLLSSSAKLLPINTILMTSRATLGEMKVAKVECCTNQGFKSLIPNEDVDPWFLYYQMKRKKPEYERFGIGSTFLEVNKKDTDAFLVEIPKYSVQKKISKILTTIDQLIEKIQALIDKHTAIKQGMMADLFTRGIDLATGQLRPPVEQAPHLYKETELGWIPKEWDIESIENSGIELVDGDRGSNYPSADDLLKEGYCVFLSANNVTKKGFSWSKIQFITEEKHNKLGTGTVISNDVVITTRGTVGNIAYYGSDLPYEAIRINSGMLILRNHNVNINPEYLYNLYTEYLFKIEYQKVVSGSAQPQLPAKDLKRFSVFMPTLDEQNAINARVKDISRLITKEAERLDKLIKTKTGLMQDLLTGKVSV